jgi:leucyl/phenylalanyl-tRNA--protein transferase
MSPQLRISDVPHKFAEGTEDKAPPKTRAQIRAECFSESWSAARRRIGGAPLDLAAREGAAASFRLAGATLRGWTIGGPGLPSPETRLSGTDGFCGVASDPGPSTIMGASARGLVAAAPLGPVAWWAPSHRWIAEPGPVPAPGPYDRTAGRDRTLLLDQEFERVVAKCAAAPQQPDGLRTLRERGLSPRLMHVFAELFDAGLAHCFALRDRSGALLGGGFGLAVGRVFLTQGRFGRVPGAATAAFDLFNRQLAERRFAICEAPAASDLADLEFRPVARQQYQQMLAAHLGGGSSGRWEIRQSASGARARADRQPVDA